MKSQLRQLALAQQGLLPEYLFAEGITGTLSAIEHLGYVQIDTLSVIERAHHHILWNRISNYNSTHLNQLIKQKQIFEYWYHAASYLPMRDYRYALRHMTAVRGGDNRYYQCTDEKLMQEILARTEAEGTLKMRDFGEKKPSNGHSWNWGPVRRAFDQLFMQGDLMVCERNGMEKIYTLTKNCLPTGIDLSMPTLTEYATYLFDTTRRAHGVFTWKQLMHLKTGKALRHAMTEVLNDHIDAGIVEKITAVDGLTAFVDSEALEQLSDADHNILKILSPFDNTVIHRDRLRQLFEFDYTLECYVTPAKRVFGYFCLPILYNQRMVGRIDCKAHRSDERLEVISLHLEDQSLSQQEDFVSALNQELQRFAAFNNCSQVENNSVQ